MAEPHADLEHPAPAASPITRPETGTLPHRKWESLARRLGLAALRVLGLVALGTAVVIRLFSAGWVFCPEQHAGVTTGRLPATPRGVQDVYLTTDDGVRIYAWWLPRDDARWTFIYFHGNAGNLDSRIMWVRHLASLPANVLALDYRGYGRSLGAPSEEGLYLDAKAAFEHLTVERGVPARDVVVYGVSLGGGVACWLAEHEECRALILQSTFTSVTDMADIVFAPVPAGWLVPVKLDNLSRIPDIAEPLLVIHSHADETIPYYMAERLYASASGMKRLAPFDDSGHNWLIIDQHAEVIAVIRSFLEECAAR